MTLLSVLLLFPAANLNYEVNATALRTVLLALSQQSGIKLKVEDLLAEEPVILRFVDVPAEEGLDRLAKGVQAEWRVLPDGTRLLERSQRYTEQLEREIFARRVAYLEEVLEHSRERLRKPFGPAEADKLAEEFGAFMRIDPARRTRNIPMSAQLQALREQTPLQRFADRVVSGFDAEFLARLPQSERGRSYSNRPVGTQLQLPQFDPDWMEQLREETELFRTALANRQVDGEYAYVEHELSRGDLLIVAEVNSYSVSIAVVHPETEEWIAYTGLRLEDDPGLQRRLRAGEMAARLDRRKQVQINTATRELSRKFSSSNGNNPFAHELSPSTVDMLLNPERIDPLSHGFGELLIGWAKNENVNLVAHLPDMPMGFLTFLANDPVFPEQFFYLVNRQARLLEEWRDGWLTMKCGDPLTAAVERIPRPLLGEFARAIYRRGYTGLADSANLALQTSQAQFGYASDISRPLTNSYIGEPYETLRFFGLLPAKYRTRGTHEVSLNDLNASQQEALYAAIYSVNAVEGTPAEKVPFRARSMTFLFPDGLPEGTRLNITVQDNPAFFAEYRNEGGNISRDAMDIGMIASIDAQHERADIFPAFANSMRIERLRPGTAYQFWAEVELGPNWSGQIQLREERITGEPISAAQWLASLTDEQRAEYEQAKKQMLDLYRNMTEAQIREYQSEGNSTPPPPPPQ